MNISKQKIIFIIIMVFLFGSLSLIASGCCAPINILTGNIPRGSNSDYDFDITVNPDKQISLDDYRFPEKRSFDMGFTPFPYDFTIEAVEFTFANINHHSDMVVHHFDNGIPWEEALNDSKMARNIMYDLNDRISRTGADKDIYLAVTPLSTYRDQLAGYWGESENMDLPDEWKDKSFSDPEIIKAYLNYCIFMIDKFEPKYFAYGIEVNMLGKHDPVVFKDYLVLVESTYASLKSSYPDLPLFLTIQLETFNNDFENQKEIIESLLPYTDFIAISSYPFGNFTDPDDIPDEWFSRLYAMAPDKPVAIAETAFLAEDLSLDIFDGYIAEGNQKYQVRYLDLLFSEMADIDCRFITWFVIRDYDQLWIAMEEQGVDNIFKSWRDTGLIDEQGNPRLALGYWDKWLSLPE